MGGAFERGEKAKGQVHACTQYGGDIVKAIADRRPQRTRRPQACRRRRAHGLRAVLQNRAAADEAYAHDQSFEDARLAGRFFAKYADGDQHETAGGHCNETKSTDAGASFLVLPIPADRKREHIGNREIGRMGQRVPWVHVEHHCQINHSASFHRLPIARCRLHRTFNSMVG